MGGPLCVLVDSSSARHTRPWENEAHNCIGMKRDHSTLVKFSPNDSDYDEVLAKLNRMTITAVSTIPRSIRGQVKLKQLTEKEKGVIEDSLKFDRMGKRYSMLRQLLPQRAIGCFRYLNTTSGWTVTWSPNITVLSGLKGSQDLGRADVNIGGGGYGDALQRAAYSGNKQMVQLLLNAGANANSEASGYYGSALQAAAASRRNRQIVQLLLDAGANVNGIGSSGRGALQVAALNGNKQIARLLLHAGADVNIRGGNIDSTTSDALEVAVQIGNEQMVRLLLNAGANAEASCFLGRTLHAAACHEGTQILQLLLDAGADVNSFGGGGRRSTTGGSWER
jgi:ankyrin repeat protein